MVGVINFKLPHYPHVEAVVGDALLRGLDSPQRSQRNPKNILGTVRTP